MICTECGFDDGFEAPDFGRGKARAKLAIAVCQQWKCSRCLDIFEARVAEEAAAQSAIPTNARTNSPEADAEMANSARICRTVEEAGGDR